MNPGSQRPGFSFALGFLPIDAQIIGNEEKPDAPTPLSCPDPCRHCRGGSDHLGSDKLWDIGGPGNRPCVGGCLDTSRLGMALIPDDATLTERGMAEAAQGRILLIACGALAHEVLALKRLNGWTHLDLQCLPAKLHLYPDQITSEVARTVAEAKGNYSQIFILYADCGTGGLLEAKCKELEVEMLAGPHCYSFFEGNENFAAHDDEITAFYLTDFLCRQFDAFVWRPMGFDRHPELIRMMFGNYTKLVYQAQTDDPTLDAKAQDCAARLGLAYERRFTGYGDLAVEMARVANAAAKP